MNKFSLFQSIIKDRPVAYHPDFAKAIGSVQAALFLSQLLYWSDKGNNGWIYKTQKEFYEETGLSRREQETARRKLKELGILEEKYQGIPRKLYYKVNMDRLAELMLEYYSANNNAQIRHYGMADSDRQECTIPPSKLGGIRQPNTEITTENTAETTTERENTPAQPEKRKVQSKNLEAENLEQECASKNFDDGKENKNKMSRKASKYISPHAKQIINAFKHHYIQRFKCPPAIYGKSVEKLEEQLRFLEGTEKNYFTEKVIEAIPKYFNLSDTFIREKMKYSFSGFVTEIQKLINQESQTEYTDRTIEL